MRSEELKSLITQLKKLEAIQSLDINIYRLIGGEIKKNIIDRHDFDLRIDTD